MQTVVFYSWQSDSPSSVNRNFIEDALGKATKKVAADLRVENAQRPDLVIDKDTKGVPGSPDIVEEIFKKIDNCAIFVADLTSVGKSKRKRLLPNPNVLVEYGYALKSVGKQRIIAVMNTAFGKPTEVNMPFNIKKLRWPIQFLLKEGAEQTEREKVKASLVDDFSYALTIVIKAGLLDNLNLTTQALPTIARTLILRRFFSRGNGGPSAKVVRLEKCISPMARGFSCGSFLRSG